MTTKQIAEAVGKTDRAVRGWIARLAEKDAGVKEKLSASSPAYPADYTLDQTIQAIEIGLGKNAAALYRENAKHSPGQEDRLDRMERMILDLTKAVAGLIPALAVAKAPTVVLPAPPMATRDELRRIMVTAGNASGDYSGAWGQLYQEIYYRLHRNVKECAKNRGMSALDYMDGEGILPEVVSIAREVFQ